jgi:hypothetical protein
MPANEDQIKFWNGELRRAKRVSRSSGPAKAANAASPSERRRM